MKMKTRERLLSSLQDSTDTERSLELIGEILLDIRDLLIPVQVRVEPIPVEVTQEFLNQEQS